MCKSPFGFQAPKLLWSWVLIIKYTFEEIADILGEKKSRFCGWGAQEKQAVMTVGFHPVHVVPTEELKNCSNVQTILIFLGFFE